MQSQYITAFDYQPVRYHESYRNIVKFPLNPQNFQQKSKLSQLERVLYRKNRLSWKYPQCHEPSA
jgi:hypothetical protein